MKTFVCQECKRELAWPLIGEHQNAVNALCRSCCDAGIALQLSHVKGFICPECGVHCGELSIHRCKRQSRLEAKRSIIQLLLRRQSYRCLGCRVHFQGHYQIANPKPNAFVIDHDHSNGFIRGLLCHDCNYALGVARDDPARILQIEHETIKSDEARPRLAEYLRGPHTGVRYNPFFEAQEELPSNAMA